MTKSQIQQCQTIVEHYGLLNQGLIFCEEAGEAVKAVTKCIRVNSEENRDNLAEEFADVLVMMRQMMLQFKIEDSKIDKIVDYKLSRQLDRIKQEEKHE